jgi:superfamily II DNA or RNA helicase
MSSIPDLIDNRKYRLASVLIDILSQSQQPKLDVVTAFFNLKGLESLGEVINRVTHLRLLLGKEQEQSFVMGERLLAELEDSTARGEIASKDILKRKNFLALDFVEIRCCEKDFVHGKAYLVHGIPALGALGIVGSSNFTGAGLTTNLELNAVLKQGFAVNELKAWFESLWKDSKDYKTEILELLERFTRSYTPYEIYIKVIYEALRDRLEQELSEKDSKPSPIALADFQHDGYSAAREIIENYGGVLIADSVGLGKTFLALRLLEDYAYKERQTALIVCPAAIENTVWRPLLQRFAIPHEIITMEKISRTDFCIYDYTNRFKIIVVDESHNFRNPDTRRWTNLFKLITQGDSDKKIIFLTATPVNNTVFDLYHQLRLLTQDNRRFLLSAGIPDLWEYFLRAEKNKDALYEILEAIAVRRSRQFIHQNYPHAEIDGRTIKFPDRALHTVHYSLKDTYGADLYKKISRAIESLFLAPYQIDTYRRELVEARKDQSKQLALFEFEALKDHEAKAIEYLQKIFGWTQEQAHQFLMTIGRQAGLTHIMRVLFLKRLESSVEALRISLRRLYRFLDLFIQALNKGRLLSSESYRQWLQMETSDEEAKEEGVDDFDSFINSLKELPADDYDIEKINAATAADLGLLKDILSELEYERPDNKLESLKNLLSSSDLQNKKIIIFSYFKDTIRYLFDNLSRDEKFIVKLGRKRISLLDSKVKPSDRSAIIIKFAPKANGKSDMPEEEQIHLLFSTDVLSEGQNLQDGEVIINYDLHWNPIRMVQRIGRLDRLGSPHDLIHVYNFFPEEELEDILRLLKRLFEKLDAINRTVGLDASILGETPNPMDFNILRRIQNEDKTALQELEGESELSIGEFLKQDLLQFLKGLGEQRLKRIPLGVGTIWTKPEGPKGFFAAFRNPVTDQHHWLFYDEEKDRIIDRRLEAIRHIRCNPEEPPGPDAEEFDPRALIGKLRRHLWNRIRAAIMAPTILPSPQRQIVNWLHAQPPSADRNKLLKYFETAPLSGPDLKELRRLWREKSSQTYEEWFQLLLNFAESHPHLISGISIDKKPLAPEKEEYLECIAWMKIK